MRFRILLALIILYSGSVIAETPTVSAPTINIHELQIEPLTKGFQGLSLRKPSDHMIGRVSAPTLLYRLPRFDYNYDVTLISHVTDRNTLFYPLVIILDENGVLSGPFRTPGGFRKTGRKHPSLVVDLLLKPTDRYLIVTSLPAWFGKSFKYMQESTVMLPLYNGSTTTYVPMLGSPSLVDIKLGRDPELEFRVPNENERFPFIRQQGFFLQMGVSTGGDKIASNPDGDSYRAGGGVLVGLGNSHQIFNSSHWTARYSAAFRFQGGQGANEGIVVQSSIVFSRAKYIFGAGLYGDFANFIEDASGNRIEFDPAIGPSLFAEWRASDTLNFGLRLVGIDYKGDDGIKYSGDQAALYIIWWSK